MQRVLTIFVLLCLWSNVQTVIGFTPKQLDKTTRYIRNTFTRNINTQHAYVVKFSAAQCRDLTDNDIKEALGSEDPKDVEKTVLDSRIYQGTNMVMATFERIGNIAVHAEYRLLYPTGSSTVSPVEDLLNKQPEAGCVLFYTLISPCVGRCARPGGQYNILDKLGVFSKINNRSFVYRFVYTVDQERPPKDVWRSWEAVNSQMSLYRCINNTCYKCIDNGVRNGACIAK